MCACGFVCMCGKSLFLLGHYIILIKISLVKWKIKKKFIGSSSFNCKGLANISKRNEIFTLLNYKSDIQIVCMQETHSNSENESKWRSE